MAVEVRGLLSGLLGVSSTSALVGQDRTILGPLTTTFTPPASCTLAAATETNDDLQGFLARTCDGLLTSEDASCWPATSQGAPSPSPSIGGFYSPGIVCPAGYATACLATGGAKGTSDWDVQFTLSAGETAAGCCPNGYTCGNNGGQTCIQAISTGTVSTLDCPLLGSAKTGVLTVDGSDAAATMTLFAPMIQINWQSTDRATAATSTSTISSPSSTQAAQTSSPTSQPGSPTLGGTQTISTESSAASGTLEMAPSTSALQGSQGIAPVPTAGGTTTGGTGSDGDDSSSGSNAAASTNEQTSSNSTTRFPVAATIGISVAGGLGAFGVGVWACYMYQRRRRYRKDMLQGINDDRMLQQMDHMYETTRPNKFDVIGSEVPYELKRQDTHSSSGGGGGGQMQVTPPEPVMYGPGQETARFFRAGPQRSPQVIGHFAGVTTAHGANPGSIGDMGALDPEYDRYNYRR